MIEVDKTYMISVNKESKLADDLLGSFGAGIEINRIQGKVTHIHPHGFLFKLKEYPKASDVNILWEALVCIRLMEDVDESS